MLALPSIAINQNYMKNLILFALLIVGACTSVSTQNEFQKQQSVMVNQDIFSKDGLLSSEQVNYLNQNELPKNEDFKNHPIPENIKKYMIPPILNGSVIVETDRNGKPEKTTFVFNDSLLVEMTQRNNTSKIDYDEQKRISKVNSINFSYNKDGLFNKYQWGTRSKEYKKENNCITEIYLDGRDQLEMYKAYCYDTDKQIISDSSWFCVFENGKYVTVNTSVTNFEYYNKQITKSSHAQYKDSEKLKSNIQETETHFKLDPETEAFYSFDTLRKYSIKYSYFDTGLLKEKKTFGWQKNTNDLKKEVGINKTIQYKYDFISEEPLKIRTTKITLDDQKESVTHIQEISFNREGYPTQRTHRGPSILDPDFYLTTTFTYLID